MARNWISVINPPQNPPNWGIPAAQITAFITVFDAARTALPKVQSDTERTPVATAQCNAAFKALRDTMRFIKAHYFLVPPLAESDLASLGLKPGNTEHAPIPAPGGQVTADLGYPAAHMIELSNFRALGAPSKDPRSDYGVGIKIGIVGGTAPYHIGEPPASDEGNLLPFYLFTRRRRERLDLSGNSGKMICISISRENAKGEPGPFCPVITAIIP
jgi:hypothetical protein